MNIVIVRNEKKEESAYEDIVTVIHELNYRLVGFIDTGTVGSGTLFWGRPLYRLEQLGAVAYDLVLEDGSLPKDSGIPGEKIRSIFWLLQNKMLLKYEASNDWEIQKILSWWMSHELSVFNYPEFISNVTFNTLHYDADADLPYTWFKTVTGSEKKMYLPKNCLSFTLEDGTKVVLNMLQEQFPGSPHLYAKKGHEVEEGDVIIDGGVCEGNFSLRYIDIASHLYLFEVDKIWEKPLYYTFKDYDDKVDIHFKALSETGSGNSVKLDDVIPASGRDQFFLKLDVEGAEPEVLRGGREILRRNRTKCSICAYHNSDDEFKIKALLRNFGYKTSLSSGYMVFIYDPEIWKKADFRRGVVYGCNG